MNKTHRQHQFFFLPLLLTAFIFPFGIEGGLVVLLIATFSLFIYLYFYQQDKTLGLILYAGFFLRVFVALVDEKFAILPYAWDDYFTTAMNIKENFLTGYPLFDQIDMSVHVKSYSVFSAIWYLLLGNYEIIVRLVNCVLGMLIVERLFRICQNLKIDLVSSHWIAALAAFWPSFILFNSLNMRDTLIIVLSIDMVYRFLLYIEKKRSLIIAIILIEFALLAVLRMQNVLVYLAVLATYVFIAKLLRYNIRRILRPLPLLFLVVVMVILIQMSAFLDAVFRYISVEMAGRSIGGSAYLVGQSYDSWIDVIKFAPIRFIYFSFGPFPWQVRNPFMLISFVESVAFLVLFVSAFKYIFENKLQRSDKVNFLLYFALIGLATNALIDSNFGTAIRHKMNYIIIFMIFAVPYVRQIKFTLFSPHAEITEC